MYLQRLVSTELLHEDTPTIVGYSEKHANGLLAKIKVPENGGLHLQSLLPPHHHRCWPDWACDAHLGAS